MVEGLGTAVRRARQARGWSQQRLALEAGVDQHQVSRIETDDVDPRLSTLQRLLRVLGLRLYVENDIARVRRSA